MSLKVGSVIFLFFSIILSLCLVDTQIVNSQLSEIIFIRVDGSVEPSTSPIQRVGDVYTLINDIVDSSFVVQRDNIVVDGSGYILQGQGERGIDLSYRRNVTIRDMQIGGGFFHGIYLSNSLSNTITGNNIVNNMGGIMIQNSSNNVISANNITNNDNGICIFSSSNNKLRNNIMNNRYNFAVYGTELSHFINDVDVSNIVNGRRVYYVVDENDMVISPSAFPDLGFLALVNCANITVRDLELANNTQGVILAFTVNSLVTKNYITNNSNGVGLYSSSNNFISGNHITNNYRGIQLSKSSKSNSIFANNITNNMEGVYLFESSQNTIDRNNITKSLIGIGFSVSSNNVIHHNNFINNTKQVYDSHMDNSLLTPSVNFWDIGYPLGGNYWSDYAGSDVKSGPDQDQLGGDGVGDTPHIIYENNKDNYPLMPYGSPPAISIVSPENKTYTVNHVDLNFTVSEPTSWIGYSLDGQANATISGNTTLTGLSEGFHSLEVWAKDTAGKTGTSETIYFSVNQKTEPFPTTWIAAIVTIMICGVTLLVYFIKMRARRAEQKDWRSIAALLE